MTHGDVLVQLLQKLRPLDLNKRVLNCMYTPYYKGGSPVHVHNIRIGTDSNLARSICYISVYNIQFWKLKRSYKETRTGKIHRIPQLLCKGKGICKVVPLLSTKHHAMKAYWGSADIATRILNLGTRWRLLVSFTSRPLYPHGKSL
jgi:hypothetical protein